MHDGSVNGSDSRENNNEIFAIIVNAMLDV